MMASSCVKERDPVEPVPCSSSLDAMSATALDRMLSCILRDVWGKELSHEGQKLA